MTDFLWGTPAPPTRGPKPALDLERIADAAVAVADAENLAAVSMQRVAAELGYTKMSLYRYLPGKAELVALMVERAIGAPPVLPASHWRGGLTTWAHRLLEGLLQHPWALEALTLPRPIGPNEMAWMEAAVSLLTGTGLTGHERLDTVAVLAGQVRVIAHQSRMNRHPEADLVTSISAVLGEHGDQYPAMAATMAEASRADGSDQAFDFGLDRMLDGLQVLIDQRSQLHGSARTRPGR